MKKLIELNLLSRCALLWLVFTAILWIVFAVGVQTHPQAWNSVPPVDRETGWHVFWFILGHNVPLLMLIAIGNLFIRFGSVTPGALILAYQAAAIGWTAGTNSFLEPFPTIAAANNAFLRIGLWETTSYVLICAVTVSKSLYIADSFPARRWIETKKLRTLRFNLAETAVAGTALLCLISAAIFEAF